MRLKRRIISFIVCLAFVSSCPMTLGEQSFFNEATLSANALINKADAILSINGETPVAGYKITVECSDGSVTTLFVLRDGYLGWHYCVGDSVTSCDWPSITNAMTITNTMSGYDNCILNTMLCSSTLANQGFNSIDSTNRVLLWGQSNVTGQTFSDFLDNNKTAQDNLYGIIFDKIKGGSAMATAEDNFRLKLEPVFAVKGFDCNLGNGAKAESNVLLTPAEVLQICSFFGVNKAARVQFFGEQYNSTNNENFINSLRKGNNGCNYYSIELIADTSSQIDEYVIPTRPYVTYHSTNPAGNQIMNLISMPNEVWSDIVEVFEYVKEEGKSAPETNLYASVANEANTLRGLYKQALGIAYGYTPDYKEAYKNLWKAITEYYRANNITLASYKATEDSQTLTLSGSVVSGDNSAHDIGLLWSYDGFEMYRDNSTSNAFNNMSTTLSGFPAKFFVARDNKPVKFARGSYNLLNGDGTLGEITLVDLLEHPYSLFIEASVRAEDEESVNSLQETLQPPVLLCYEDDSQTESSLTINKSIWEKYKEIYSNLITGDGTDESTVFNPSLSGVTINTSGTDSTDFDNLREQWRTLQLFQTFRGLSSTPQPIDLTGTSPSGFLEDAASSTIQRREYDDSYPEQNRDITTTNIVPTIVSKDYYSGWLLEKLVAGGTCVSIEDNSLKSGLFSGTILGTDDAYYASSDSLHNFPFFESGFGTQNSYDFTKHISQLRFEDTREIVASWFTDKIVTNTNSTPINTGLLSSRKKSNVNPTRIEGNNYYVVSSSNSNIPTEFRATSSSTSLEVLKGTGSSKTFDYGEKLTFTCSDKVVVDSTNAVMNPGKNLGDGDNYWDSKTVDSVLKVASGDTLYDPVVIHITGTNGEVMTYDYLREFATTGTLSGVNYEVKKELTVGELLADPYRYGIVYTSLSEQSVGSTGSNKLEVPLYVHTLNAKLNGRTGLPLLSDFVRHTGLESLGTISGNTSSSYISSYVKVKDDSANLNTDGDTLLTFERGFGTTSGDSIQLKANTFQHSVLDNGNASGHYGSNVSTDKNISLLKIDSSTLDVKSPAKQESKTGNSSLNSSATEYKCYDNGTSIHLRDTNDSVAGYQFHPYWLQYEATDESPYYSLGKYAKIPEPYRSYTGKTGYYFGSTNTKDSSDDYSYELVKVYDSGRTIEYKPAVYVDIEFNDCLKLKTNWATDKTSLELMSKSGFPVAHAGQAVTATTQSDTGYTVTITATTLIPKSGLESEAGMNCNGRFASVSEFEDYINGYYVYPLTNDSRSRVKDASNNQFKTSMESGLASTLRGVYYDSTVTDIGELSKLSAYDFKKSTDTSFTASDSQYQSFTGGLSESSTSNATPLFLRVAEKQEDIEALLINKSNSKYYEAYSSDLSDLVNPNTSTNVNEYQIADYFDMVTLTYTITVNCPSKLDFVVDLEESDSRNSLKVIETDKMHTGTASDYVVEGSVLGDLLNNGTDRMAYTQEWQDYFGESIVNDNTFSCYNEYARTSDTMTSIDYCYSHFLVPYVTVDLDGYLKALGVTCGSGKALEGHKITLTDNLGASEVITGGTNSPVKYLVGSQTWLNVYGNIYDNT